MITGLNHNIMHNGNLYHIQTEDSGRRNPHVISHLFLDGVILATERTSYESSVDLPEDEFTEAVKKIINKSHRMMINKLVTGGYDHLAQSAAIKEQAAAKAQKEPEKEVTVDLPAAAPIELTPAPSVDITAAAPAEEAAKAAAIEPQAPAEPTPPQTPRPRAHTNSDSFFEAQEAELNLYLLLGQKPKETEEQAPPPPLRQAIMHLLGISPE